MVVLLAVIMGATEVECDNMEDVMACLEQGSAYRHTGSTQMNEHSSRSHSVFTMLIGQSLGPHSCRGTLLYW